MNDTALTHHQIPDLASVLGALVQVAACQDLLDLSRSTPLLCLRFLQRNASAPWMGPRRNTGDSCRRCLS